MVRVGLGKLAREARHRLGIGKQVLAPFLREVVQSRVGSRRRLERAQTLGDRRRVDVAHDLADVLHLAAPRLVPGDALAREHRVAQRLRQVEARELPSESSTSAAPTSCRSRASRLRRVLLIKSSSSMAA